LHAEDGMYRPKYDPRIRNGETEPWYRAPVRGSKTFPLPFLIFLLGAYYVLQFSG